MRNVLPKLIMCPCFRPEGSVGDTCTSLSQICPVYPADTDVMDPIPVRWSANPPHMRPYCGVELSDDSIQEEQSCLSPWKPVLGLPHVKNHFQRGRILCPDGEHSAKRRPARSGHSGAYQRGQRRIPPPLRIAATCHSSKSGVFGSPVQKGLVQAGRAPGALPTGNLVAQMFRMPAQAGCAGARGLFGSLETRILSTLSGEQPGFSGQTRRPGTSLVDQEQFSVRWQGDVPKDRRTQVN